MRIFFEEVIFFDMTNMFIYSFSVFSPGIVAEIRELKQRRRRRQRRRLVNDEFISYKRDWQLSRSVWFANSSKNLLRLNMQQTAAFNSK